MVVHLFVTCGIDRICSSSFKFIW